MPLHYSYSGSLMSRVLRAAVKELVKIAGQAGSNVAPETPRVRLEIFSLNFYEARHRGEAEWCRERESNVARLASRSRVETKVSPRSPFLKAQGTVSPATPWVRLLCILTLVPREGIEPSYPYGYQFLRLTRMPVPPPRR